MLSLRSYAHCIGIRSAFRLRRDFFGYETSPPWGAANALPRSVSLRTQMQRLNLQYFNLSVIKVGAALDGSDGYWDLPKAQEIDCSIQLSREIYANLGFGIGRVTRWDLPGVSRSVGQNSFEVLGVGVGQGFDRLFDRGSPNNLVQGWEAAADGIEVFVVENYAGADGVGNTPWGEDGFIVEIRGLMALFPAARTLAHELGHFLIRGGYFGNEHRDDPTHLMTQSSNAPVATDIPSLLRTTRLYSQELRDIRTSDWVKAPCFPPIDTSGEPILPRVPSPWEEPLAPDSPASDGKNDDGRGG